MTRKGKNKKGGTTTENVVVPKAVEKVIEILPEIKKLESKLEQSVTGGSSITDKNEKLDILKKEQQILENPQNVEMSNTDLNNSATDKPKRKRNRNKNKNKTNQNETNDDVSIQQTDIKSTETVSDINSIIVENSSEGTSTSKKKRNRNKKSKIENSNGAGENPTENKIDSPDTNTEILIETDIVENQISKQENKNNKAKKDNNSKKIKKDVEQKSDKDSSPIQFKNQLEEKLIENKIENQIENLVKNENGTLIKSETIPLTDKKKDENKKKNKGKKSEDIKKEEFPPRKDDDVKKEIETNKSQNSSSNKKNKKEKLSPDKSNAELDKKIELNEKEIISEVKVEKTTEIKLENTEKKNDNRKDMAKKIESEPKPDCTSPLQEVLQPLHESDKPKRPARGNKQTSPDDNKTSPPIPAIPIESSSIDQPKTVEEAPKEKILEDKQKDNKKHPKGNKQKNSPEKIETTPTQDIKPVEVPKSADRKIAEKIETTSLQDIKPEEVSKPADPKKVEIVKKEEVLPKKDEPKPVATEKSQKKGKSKEKHPAKDVKVDSIPIREPEIDTKPATSETPKVEPKADIKPASPKLTRVEPKVEAKSEPQMKATEIPKVDPKPSMPETKPVEVPKSEGKPTVITKIEPTIEEKPLEAVKVEPKQDVKPIEVTKVESSSKVNPVEILKEELTIQKPATLEVKPVEEPKTPKPATTEVKPKEEPKPAITEVIPVNGPYEEPKKTTTPHMKEKPPIPERPKEMKSLADVLKEAPNVTEAQPAPSKPTENQLLSEALNELIESVDLIKTNVGEGSKNKFSEKPTKESSPVSKNVERSDFVQSVDQGAKSLDKNNEKILVNDKKVKDEANIKQMENLTSEAKTHELPEKTAQEKLDPVKFAPVKLIDILDAKMVVPEQQARSTGAIKKNTNKAAPDPITEVQKSEKPKVPPKPEHLNKSDRKSPMPANKTDVKEKKLNKKPEIAPKPTTLPPPPMKKPPPPVEDEDEEFIEYKFIPRQVFLATICQVCQSPISKFIACKLCQMVSYCSEKHTKEDEPHHKHLCQAMQDIAKKRGGHVYHNAKVLSDDEYRNLRVHTMNMCQTILKRPLQPFEREILLFPRLCYTASCREWKQQSLVNCKSCGQVAHCIEHPEHLPESHPKWCKYFALYQKMVTQQKKFGRIDPSLPGKIYQKQYELAGNMDLVLKELYKTNPMLKNDCLYASITQLATAPLTAYYATQVSKQEIGDTFVIHLIGAELQFEADTLDKWETFFLHLAPQLTELKIVFIGPELNAENLPLEVLSRIRMCRVCRQSCRGVKFDFQCGLLYHDYCKLPGFVKPDLVCFFNPGLHRSTGFNELDTWPETIRSSVSYDCPIVVTSYTEVESPLDFARLEKECNKTLNVLKSPDVNPFSSYRPERNFISDEIAPMIFKNYYCFIVK